jgi:hypothetical protein
MNDRIHDIQKLSLRIARCSFDRSTGISSCQMVVRSRDGQESRPGGGGFTAYLPANQLSIAYLWQKSED